MRLFSFPFVLIILSLFVNGNKHSSTPSAGIPTCAYPEGRPLTELEALGRCTGSAYCNICKDCSRCGYCNGGGACGVCSGGGSSRSNLRSSNYSTGNSSTSSSRSRSVRSTATYSAPNTGSYTTTILLPIDAIVASEMLNLRSGPGTEYDILLRLSAGDSVTITAPAGNQWVQVEVTVSDGVYEYTLEGYVFKKYLSY